MKTSHWQVGKIQHCRDILFPEQGVALFIQDGIVYAVRNEQRYRIALLRNMLTWTDGEVISLLNRIVDQHQ